MLKHINTAAVRNAVIAALTASVVVVAATSHAQAAKRVCYKDPGRGIVCQTVP
jgi:hypothetical protein